MKSMPLRQVNLIPCEEVLLCNLIAFFIAVSKSHHMATMWGLDCRQASTRDCNSSSGIPISRAPIAFNAPTLPP